MLNYCRYVSRLLVHIQNRMFYAVAKGRIAGIYNSWPECESQVKGFHGPIFKKFKTYDEAQTFILQRGTGECLAKKAKTVNSEMDEDEINFLKLKESSESSGNSRDQNVIITEFVISKSSLLKQSDVGGSQSSEKKNSVEENSEVSKEITSGVKFSIPVSIPLPTKEVKYSGKTFNADDDGYVHVYTDGSCMNNGKSNAISGLGVYFGEDNGLNVSEAVTGKKSTNNVGEYQAAIRAIEIANEYSIPKLRIFTDSQILIKSVCFWMKKWKYNNWKKPQGGDVVNKEILQKIDRIMEESATIIMWSYIPGHKGYFGNEQADILAKLGAYKMEERRSRRKRNIMDEIDFDI